MPTPATFPCTAFPADPYPGAVPPFSFVQLDGTVHRLDLDPDAPSGWSLAGRDLDAWLLRHSASPSADRVPVRPTAPTVAQARSPGCASSSA